MVEAAKKNDHDKIIRYVESLKTNRGVANEINGGRGGIVSKRYFELTEYEKTNWPINEPPNCKKAAIQGVRKDVEETSTATRNIRNDEPRNQGYKQAKEGRRVIVNSVDPIGLVKGQPIQKRKRK